MAAVWGIDIGKAALKAVKLRRTKEGLEIKAVEHIAYPAEDDEEQKSEHVNDALRQFLIKHKVGSDQVVVAIAGLHAFSRFIKLPPVDGTKLTQMVRMEAQQQIPFPIAEVNWDWVKIDREYAPGEEVEVGIFASRSELIDGFLRDLREVNAAPDVVTIAPLAVYNFVRYNREAEEGATIILDIGSEHTDLVIMDGERFWIRNLRIAGNDITKALAERFKVPFAEAEKLKRQASKSEQSKKIFSAMESVLKDLVGEVHRSVGFFKSQADDLEIKRMVLLGDGAKLKNATKYLSEQLGYDVERVQQLEQDKFIIDPEVDLDVLKNHLLGFGVSFGLAIQGVGLARCAIDLAPEDVKINSQLRTKAPFALAAAACAWGALVLGHMSVSSATDKVNKTVDSAKALTRFQEVQNQAQAVKDVSAVEAQAVPLTALGEGRTFMLELVSALNDVLPRENARLPDIPADWLDRELPQQLQQFKGALERDKTHEKKIWLLEMNVSERTEEPAGGAGGFGEPTPARGPVRKFFRVELLVAKALPQGKQDFAIRDEIRTEFVGPLVARLSGAPFFIRDGERTPAAYGEASVGTLARLYQLHPAAQQEPGRGQAFPCIAVPIKFEVGLAKAAPPPPPPAEGE
ncbi:MAG: type IV pilus assembly protein PilM [Planctomycetota bacterium]|nr:type IV pilus assembly protein PilM [Planctomycetota bacterium]